MTMLGDKSALRLKIEKHFKDMQSELETMM